LWFEEESSAIKDHHALIERFNHCWDEAHEDPTIPLETPKSSQ
jgi:hypothetical protein